MIKIQDTIKDIVDSNIEVKNSLAKGLINLSSYARTIQKQVVKKAKKEVSVQSIVVALSRIERKLKAYDYLPDVKITQLSVKKPIVELVYQHNEENLKKLAKVAAAASTLEDSFLSFSTSTQDIAIVVSENIEDKVRQSFDHEPKVYKEGLAAVSIRFGKGLVEESGVGFVLMQRIAARNIVLDEVVSTFNEFTLVFAAKQLPRVLEALEDY